jgi:alkaline phosphatase D
VDPTKNFTHQWALENLQPGTRYAVTLEARPDQAATGPSATLTGFFQTAPAAESAEPITFTVVTCHDYIRTDHPDGHRIYKSMLDLNPDFYVHTGDIEYYDKPDPWAMTEELMYFKWDRLFALPLQRHFWTQVTSYFMKDDHDTLDNDCSPGDTYGTVTWDRGLEIFDEEQFPTHDPSYKTIRWGKDLQIWLTEGRTYRSQNSAPDGPDKTIFGQEQLDWLFSTLQESDATFKVVINANPVVGPDRGGKKDNYANSNFSHEGQEIRDFINELDNVYLCNGDRHWQYVSNPPGTNLWEFSCGPGADKHAGGWNPNDTRPEHKFLRVKGGFLKVSVEPAGDERPAKIVFEHCDVEGNVVNREEFTPAST